MTSSEKDCAGALLDSKVLSCMNNLLNEQHQSRQQITQQNEHQTFTNNKYQSHIDNLKKQNELQNMRLL